MILGGALCASDEYVGEQKKHEQKKEHKFFNDAI
jgi:hypothetical protein